MKRLLCIAVTVLFFSCGTLLSLAQSNSDLLQRQNQIEDVEGEWDTLIRNEGLWTKVLSGEAVPASLSSLDLNALTKEEWKQLRRAQMQALRSRDPHVRSTAMQNVIYLALYFSDKVNLKPLSSPLLNTYRFERNETTRIMALAAIHAIGYENTMVYLSKKVRFETSPRVRRLTIAALADYVSKQRAESVTR